MKFDAYEMSKLSPAEFSAACYALGAECRAERAFFWRKVRWGGFAVIAAAIILAVFLW